MGIRSLPDPMQTPDLASCRGKHLRHRFGNLGRRPPVAQTAGLAAWRRRPKPETPLFRTGEAPPLRSVLARIRRRRRRFGHVVPARVRRRRRRRWRVGCRLMGLVRLLVVVRFLHRRGRIGSRSGSRRGCVGGRRRGGGSLGRSRTGQASQNDTGSKRADLQSFHFNCPLLRNDPDRPQPIIGLPRSCRPPASDACARRFRA